jgi:MFS family permease
MALGIAGAAASPNVWVAAASVVVSGAGNGAAIVCNALLVQRGAPDRLRGRAFTVLMSSNVVFLTLGMVLAARVTDQVGPRWVWGAAAMLSTAAAVTGFTLARGVREAPPAAAEPAEPVEPRLEPGAVEAHAKASQRAL